MRAFAWGRQQCCVCGIDSMVPEMLAGMACSVGTVGAIESRARRTAVFRLPEKHALADEVNVESDCLSASSPVRGNEPAIVSKAGKGLSDLRHTRAR
ncbi:hypothetical protein BCAR13_110019 [Paraburkholderia caribensis]|nr:hypothetical protein BCAR13_110019 [Paraburkholderia caribensis]